MHQPTETCSYSNSDEMSLVPHQNDGDFLSLQPVPDQRPFPRPIYTNPVRDGGVKEYGKTIRDGHMTLTRYEVTMENGTAYDVSVAQSNRSDALDIAHLETTSLTTQPDGLNMLRMKELASRGISTLYQSVQKNQLRCGSIRESSHDSLDIHTALAERYGFDQTHIITGGISRGGGQALYASSVAARHNKHVVYTDAEVPAPPERIHPVRFLARLAVSLPHEVHELLQYHHVPLDDLMRYHKTVDVLPHKVAQQLKEIPGLLNGDLGKQIAHGLPIDAVGYVTAHRNDMFIDSREWVRALARHDHMVIDTSPGAHMSCAGMRDRTAWRRRMETVAEVLGDNSTRTLGGAALHALLSETNPVFGASRVALAKPLAA